MANVLVNDQEKALQFYTHVLGFEKNQDISMGAYRWLTVSSPEGLDGVQLVLEPISFPPAEVYQKAMFSAGIPSTAFFSKNIQVDFFRLKELGVQFRGEPKNMGPVTGVLFDDTCGNLINLVQPNV